MQLFHTIDSSALYFMNSYGISVAYYLVEWQSFQKCWVASSPSSNFLPKLIVAVCVRAEGYHFIFCAVLTKTLMTPQVQGCMILWARMICGHNLVHIHMTKIMMTLQNLYLALSAKPSFRKSSFSMTLSSTCQHVHFVLYVQTPTHQNYSMS